MDTWVMCNGQLHAHTHRFGAPHIKEVCVCEGEQYPQGLDTHTQSTQSKCVYRRAQLECKWTHTRTQSIILLSLSTATLCVIKHFKSVTEHTKCNRKAFC